MRRRIFEAVAKFRSQKPRDLIDLGDEGHSVFFDFENCIDLRRPRIRRIKKFRVISEPVETEERMGEAETMQELQEISRSQDGSDRVKEVEEIEMMQGYQPLPRMVDRYLGFEISRKRHDLAVRPIHLDTLAIAGVEVHALIQLDEIFVKMGFEAPETLGCVS